jgi:hypothetical protein
MAEKVSKLGINTDHKQFMYYISGEGHVHARHKKTGDTQVLHRNAVTREPGHLYYVDKDGDVSRSPMARRGKKE